MFGYVAFISHALHICGGLFNVYMDVVRNLPLPKMILIMNVVVSSGCMCRAVVAAIQKEKGWRLTHQDEIIWGYIVSIQGAGPIRMITEIQSFFNCGPLLCQSKYGGLATYCQYPYIGRFLLMGLWATWTHGFYVKMRGDREMIREYMRHCSNIAMVTTTFLIVSNIPGSSHVLNFVLGQARSWHGAVTTLCVGVALVLREIRMSRPDKPVCEQSRAVGMPRLLGAQFRGQGCSQDRKTK